MSRRIMLIPVGFEVGLTSVSLGMMRVLERQGINSTLFKPISQVEDNKTSSKNDVELVNSRQIAETSVTLSYVEQQISDGNYEHVLEEIVGHFDTSKNKQQITIIEGLVPTQRQTYAGRINNDVARALSADIILVTSIGNDSLDEFEDRLIVAAATYGGMNNKRVIGCIVNKLNAPNKDEYGLLVADQDNSNDIEVADVAKLSVFKRKSFQLLGTIPWDVDLIAPRVTDMADYLNAEIINQGDIAHRRIRSISFCARSVSNMVSHLTPNRLIVTPGDRTDVIIASCLSALNGTKVGALLLTNGYKPNEQVLALCQQAFDTGLPVLSVTSDTWKTSRNILNFTPKIPLNDKQRIERVKDYVADHISLDWLNTNNIASTALLSPAAFRHQLTVLAKQANKLIVLPEGNDARTIKAASICAEKHIARCLLLGDEEEIQRIAQQQGVELCAGVSIVNPDTIRQHYVAAMVEARKHKGLTDIIAYEELKDNVVLGTMMLHQGDVDGLVSGAVNTTANTIRPALQLIKTASNASLVSSIFFMLMPEQVFVYGDCAINPEPNAQQLAEIAIVSADSAAQFGIEPRVAMISYSTGQSGQGADVEKVKQATAIAKERRPDLIIDGPLQYDAAVMENVAKKKAPNSPVAGKATVFIFPDLNTGNTTYKAVQRSANVVSIGPMLQGMKKPVNDLSRGALVEDIVYTIALTAIQSSHKKAD